MLDYIAQAIDIFVHILKVSAFFLDLKRLLNEYLEMILLILPDEHR